MNVSRRVAALLTLAILLPTPALMAEPAELWFRTGDAELATWPGVEWGYMRLMNAEQYEAFAEKVQDSDVIVPLDELSGDERPLVGYGINFVFDGKNRGFVVRGNRESGYVLIADMDADGSLRGEHPIPLEVDNGRFVTQLDLTGTDVTDGERFEYPVDMKFVFLPAAGTDDGTARYQLWWITARHGTIRIGGRQLDFTLYGTSGIYDDPSDRIWFDLDGSGQPPDDRQSDEVFQVREEHVNIGDRTYRFEVDRFGRSLGLAPLDGQLTDRPSLDAGKPAPGFETDDIDGYVQSLKKYEERIVLLDFWYTTCAPCIKDAPRLADLHEKHAEDGLRIIGISPDSESNIREFAKKFGHDWPQILETADDPIHMDYRVRGYPAKFLIDREGKIICGQIGDGFWEECWPKAEQALEP